MSNPVSDIRRSTVRAVLNAVPQDALRTIRHVMAYPFLSKDILPRKPKVCEASSGFRDNFWNEALGDFLGRRRAPIDYFEFGVHTGVATRFFLAANTHPSSRFFGFDSFEGLPEDWKGGMDKGHFSTNGAPPEIDDPRVRFVPGFFNRSLPEFFEAFEPSGNAVVVHFDADLYTSTVCAMSYVVPQFRRRRMLWMFDEFLNEELAAFETFVRAFDLPFRPVSLSRDHMRAAFIVNEGPAGR